MKAKKLVALALAASMAFACATVSSANTTTDYSDIEEVKICVIGSASGGNFWGNVETGFTESCEARGWEYAYWAPSGSLTGDAGVLELAETALTQGYNVICPVMEDITIFEDFLNRADEAGVLVIAYNSNPGEDYVIAQVGIDSEASGTEQGEKIAEFVNEMELEEINYVTMCSSSSMASQQLVRSAAIAAIEENYDGEMTLVGEGESGDNAATAQDALGAFYIAHPEINVIICADQYSAVGAAAFIEENGLQGQVVACGLSLQADDLIRVRDGALSATSSVDSVYMGGELLCGVVENIIAGEEFEYKNYPPKIWVLQDEVETYAEENGIELD